MRIGIDATCWANRRGYGRFTRELLSAMVRQAPQDQFICFLDSQADRLCTLSGANVSRVVVQQSVSPTAAAADGSARSPSDMLRLTRAVWREHPDVFYSPSVYSFFPLPPGQRAVVTIHDAIVERFPQLTIPSRKGRLFWKAKVRLALAQARIVLTVSEYAADEIAEMLHVKRDRLRVAVEAPADAYRAVNDQDSIHQVAARVGIPSGRRWIVYVGGFNPHKHVDLLIQAHASISAQRMDPPILVLVGALNDTFHGAQATIRAAIDSAGTAELIRWAGFMPDEELARLHAGAVALVLPSASEGFGLPAIEAAACGTPVIATTASPLPQLLEGGGIFVAPGDSAAIANALQQLLHDEPARLAMGRIARERASQLTWDAGARSALDALREAAV